MARSESWSDRGLSVPILIGIGVAAVVAWAIVVWLVGASMDLTSAGVPMSFGMSGRLSLTSASVFLGMWLAMMAAMMLPSVGPAVLQYVGSVRGGGIHPSIPLFLAGYLLVWEGFGVVAYFLYALVGAAAMAIPALGGHLPLLTGVIVVLTGIYQLSRIKRVCLTQCQQPGRRFVAAIGQGTKGALSLGTNYGVECLGCCAGMMVALVAFGAMDLRWMIAATVAIAAEKLGPRTAIVPTVIGFGLVVVGLVTIVGAAATGGSGSMGGM